MQQIDLVANLRPTILGARAFRDDRNTLAKYLPPVAKQQLSYKLGRRKRNDQTVPVRAFGAPATPIRRPGVLTVQGDLPAITPIVNLNETDLNLEFLMAQQLAGQAIDWTPWVNAGAGLVASATDNTFEVLRGQALTACELSLVAADGQVHEVDFEVPADNKITVNAAWSGNANAVFADLARAHAQFIDSSGAPAGVALTTDAVYRIMLNALAVKYPNAPVGQAELNAYLANQGLPGVETNDRVLVAENPDGSKTKTRVYPQGHLTFLPQGDTVGQTELGVTQEAIQQVQNQVLAPAEVAGLTIQVLGQDNPVERAVKGATVGMPVIHDNEDIVVLSGLIA